jgi:outer membrane protein assembly factor BamB
MTSPRVEEPARLRLWPGVVAVTLQWLAWAVLPLIAPGATLVSIGGGVLGGLLVLAWWLFFSRAPWLERGLALALFALALVLTPRVPGLLHVSIAGGMMGLMFPIYAVPVLSLALVFWAAASRRLAAGPRRLSMAAAILLAGASFALVRTGGITGDADADLHWRWTPTPEERLLAMAAADPAPAATPIPEPAATLQPAPSPDQPSAPRPAAVASARQVPAAPKPSPAWPGFRGPARDGVARGVRIETDWAASPPAELWRRPVGPGWSSFAVDGERVCTQEQRGEEELVSCYRLGDGQPLWAHADAARFYESNGGAGPRATPLLHDGRVYALGATGILNALDARDGSRVWSRNAAEDTGAQLPGWGFAGSPIVAGDTLVAATAGRLAGYDLASGRPRWTAGRDGGYSSPHLATIGGVAQVLLASTSGVLGVSPSDGRLLWEHPWRGDGIVQPALTIDGDVLIGAGSGIGDGAHTGVCRLGFARDTGAWRTVERWTTNGLKPYYNDFVVHEGHAYGFDGAILSCIDLQTGQRRWKGGRYGHGQLVLLPDQDLLLVLSEEGQLALVAAAPDGFEERASLQALEGKTWNHPAVAGDVLLVRNGEEMAAFRLARAAR